MKRCEWCGEDELYMSYHDQVWGVPVTDEHQLFEFLILEGAQAGLAWITILRKREGYRKLFADFDPAKVARFTDKKLDKLLENPAIVRNRLKVYSARQNAQAFLLIQKEFGSFGNYIWGFVDHQPIQNTVRSLQQIPGNTALSDAISKDLKKRGFNFVGSTIMYAFMQATGMVNDHITTCYRYDECAALGLNTVAF
ncbi:MAG: DNA-3-methyladenine glycosylase I [Halieaceae bacterium]